MDANRSLIIGIDPGASVGLAMLRANQDGEWKIRRTCTLAADEALGWSRQVCQTARERGETYCIAIEAVKCYGMAVGDSVIETCYLIGRLQEIFAEHAPQLVPRATIKANLCGTVKAKDSNIRQALMDVWGPRGTKSAPGGTYGVVKHEWSALAVATFTLRAREK